MRTHVARLLCAGALSSLLSPWAGAALVPLVSGKLVYDTDLDVTWVADANLCSTRNDCVNADESGGMLWQDAKQWAAGLTYLGYKDWRLPTSSDRCTGTGCTGNEMGHLFYSELGATPYSAGGSGNTADFGLVGDHAPFENIQSVRYWTETGYAAGSAGVIGAWAFGFNTGMQAVEVFGGTDDHLAAWAVRSGAPRQVAEPGVLALVGASMFLLLAVRARRRLGTGFRLVAGSTVAALLAGCASHTGVVPMGRGTYMIARQQATGFPGLGNMKAEIISEATQYCAGQGRTMEMLNAAETQGPYVLGNYPRAEIQFQCAGAPALR